MANYKEHACQDQSSGDEQEGKFILDCAAFLSFTNRRGNSNKALTKATFVNTANVFFKVINRKKIPLRTRNDKVKLHALRNDDLRQQLLSTHEILQKIGPIVLMQSEARLMNNNIYNTWIRKKSTKLEDKVKNTYIVSKTGDTNKETAEAYTAVEQSTKAKQAEDAVSENDSGERKGTTTERLIMHSRE